MVLIAVAPTIAHIFKAHFTQTGRKMRDRVQAIRASTGPLRPEDLRLLFPDGCKRYGCPITKSRSELFPQLGANDVTSWQTTTWCPSCDSEPPVDQGWSVGPYSETVHRSPLLLPWQSKEIVRRYRKQTAVSTKQQNA